MTSRVSDPLQARYNLILEDAFAAKLDELIGVWEAKQAENGIMLSNADRVGPEARHKLKGLLRYYAKKQHPFTACVNDNRKRFGDRAEGVCAVLKDIIRGTTKWRGKDNPRDHGTPGLATAMSDDAPEIDDETLALVEKLSELDLWELMGLAELSEDEPIKSYQLAHPMSPARSDYGPEDHDFLDKLHDHHTKRLAFATKHATSKTAHPELAGLAAEAVAESTRQIARLNRIRSTGRTY